MPSRIPKGRSSMIDSQWAGIESACKSLIAGSATMLRWSWDARFGAALATFPAGDATAALASLEACLPTRWDHLAIGQSPEAVRRLSNDIGGVRSGQLILSTDATQEILVVGAWWPWGGGQTLSIRLFPVASGSTGPQQEEYSTAFRSWFCP